MLLENNFITEERNKIMSLAEFVVLENYKHHSNGGLPINYYESIEALYNEEINYLDNSEVFISRNVYGDILGTIRVLKWNYKDELPIEKIFGINPLDVIGNTVLKSVWHIGRFAIKKDVRNINLFKKLMVQAISPVCKNKNSVAFAECDSKLLRIMSAMGIKATVIGESINYLGSETIPVCFTYEGLIEFYNNNKKILETKEITPNQFDLIPKQSA
jgi:predicted GNAT family N-acyltransferase